MDSKSIGATGVNHGLWRALRVRSLGPLMATAVALGGVWLVSPFSLRPRRLAPPVPARAAQSFALASDDSSSSARLTRATGVSGNEQLRGSAHLRSGGALSWVEADERAEVDQLGSLQHAEIHLSYGDSAAALGFDLAARVTLDAGAGEVRVQGLDGRTESHRVATDYPWVYLAIRLPEGKFVTTPVAVSVARRAARSHSVVRLITAGEGDASLMSDQLAVVDPNTDFIVLGNDLATFERDSSGQPELVALRVADLGVELKRQAAQRLL